MRLAYFLYRLGISANQINAAGLLISVVGFGCLSTASSGKNSWFLFMGLGLLYFHVFLDFVDGAVAKAGNMQSPIGAALDDIGPDLDRLLLFVLLGMFSESPYILLTSSAAGGLLVFLVPATAQAVATNGLIGVLASSYTARYSFLGCRFMLAVLPMCLVLVTLFGGNLRLVALGVAFFYILAALMWLVICLPGGQPDNQEVFAIK